MLLQRIEIFHKDETEDPLLHSAVRSCDERMVMIVLETGVDINTRDRRGQTALHLSCGQYQWPLGAALLLRKGADVSIRDDLGQTALHLVCSRGNNMCLYHTLMKNGAAAVVNVQDEKGRTPLHLAVTGNMSLGSSYIITSLLEHGAYMSVPDNEGKTPLKIAENNYRTMRIFTEHAFVLKCADLPLHVDYKFDYDGLEDLKISCLIELYTLKKTRLGRFSLCDVFFKSHDPSYMEDNNTVEQIQSFFESSYFNDAFFKYGNLLRQAFFKGKERLDLLQNAQIHFNIMIPNEIRRKILAYLSDSDLLSVIHAGVSN